MNPTHLDLFSGIGGFALAARWSGYDTIGFCEFDPFCARVLDRNFPGVPVHGDIHTLDADTVRSWLCGRPLDLLTGGFPCQPFSVAGRQAGKNDNRYLWPQMLRLIADLGPRWVCGENVPGIVNMEGGADRVLADLEDLGYSCWTANIPAAAVAAPHRRDRIWFVACLEPSDPPRLGPPGHRQLSLVDALGGNGD